MQLAISPYTFEVFTGKDLSIYKQDRDMHVHMCIYV